MTIAVIGAGAIGSVVAAYLTKAGYPVLLVGHSDQVEAVSRQGLTITTAQGSENIKVPIEPRLDKEYDLVIFAVKTQDLEQAYADNHRFLENCWILTTQNGVQADNILSSHFDRDKMLSSIVMFGATYVKPGEITYNFPGDWIIGKPYGPNDPHAQKIAEILKSAFPVVLVNDIMGMKWLKLFVNFNNCIPALIGKSMQETFSDLDFCRLSILLLKEGFDIVQKAGIQPVSLPQFPVERVAGLAQMPTEQGAVIINKTLTGLSKEPLYGSILQSIMRKKTSEIDYINGEVVLLAGNIRQEAPLNRQVVDMVHQVETQGRFFETTEIKKAFNLN